MWPIRKEDSDMSTYLIKNKQIFQTQNLFFNLFMHKNDIFEVKKNTFF